MKINGKCFLKKFSWKQLFQALGLFLVWIFPILTIFTSIFDQDLITAVFAFGVGLISTLVLYVLIKVIDFILPTIAQE